MFGFPTFVEIWAVLGGKLLVLCALMLIDLVMGIVIALVYKEFDWDYLTNFVKTDLLPSFAWLLVGFMNFIPKEYIPGSVTMIFETTIYATVFFAIFTSILGHLARIGVWTKTLNKLRIGIKYSEVKPKGKKLA
jgi:hypothetical protein